MEQVEAVVIGAGIVGLAVARALALAGREVIVLEAADAIGTEISSRNSEVIHAGIYYPTGSVRARFCVAGKRFLYDYCARAGIAHRRCAKLIVATSKDEIATLIKIKAQADANDVRDLEMIDGAAARAIEPQLRCEAALVSPSTGIVDSHGLMLAFQGEAEAHGAMIAFNTRVARGRVTNQGFAIETDGPDPTRIGCRILVNAAGLGAQTIARALDGYDPALAPPLYYGKGCYFSLAARSPFTRLIYPVPEMGGLGVHLTLDLAGQARFGPDIAWVDTLDYDVDPRRADVFYGAVRRYWPGLPDGALKPAYSGIRPKLTPAGAPAADFVIQDRSVHGIAGLVHLFGIESPGLTSSPAIAAHVADLVAGE